MPLRHYAALCIPGIAIGVFSAVFTALTMDFTRQTELRSYEKITMEMFDRMKEVGYQACRTDIFGDKP